jgi:hypothetical protein
MAPGDAAGNNGRSDVNRERIARLCHGRQSGAAFGGWCERQLPARRPVIHQGAGASEQGEAEECQPLGVTVAD